MSLTKIGSIGINTGIQFAGVTTVVTLNASDNVLTVGGTVNFNGDVSIGGTLTYEDVTNVDSVGIITARSNILVGSGITLSPDGNIFATGVTTATSFVGSGANLTGVLSDVVEDTSPQLGGNLDVNTKNITFGDSGSASDDRLTFGAGTDLSMYHDGSDSYISHNGTGNFYVQTSEASVEDLYLQAGNDIYLRPQTGENGIKIIGDGGVELYYNNVKHLETDANGIHVTTNVHLPDNGVLELGNDSDLLISYNSSSNTNEVASDKSTNFRGKNLYFYVNHNNSSESAIMAYANAAVDLYYDNSKKLETTNTGVTISGDLAFPSGNGINFHNYGSGTGIASNLLDDYEEGTFTPRLGPNVSMSTIHENGIGRYTKIGNMVTCTMHWIAKDGTAFPTNETIRIDNLPFTIIHLSNNTSAHYIAMSQMMYNVQFGQQHKHYFYSSHNQTYLTGLKSRDGTSWEDWSTADWNQSNLYFNTSVTYMTTS